MSALFALLLLVALAAGQTPGIVATWDCWFETYANASRSLNLVFSYNSSYPSDTPLVAGSAENTLEPAQLFQGQQPELFKQGYQAYVLTLVVPAGTSVVWRLDNQPPLVVNTAQDLTPQRRCSVALGGNCPTWIEHFCEDAAYCNGAESCFSMSLFGAETTRTMGVCVAPDQGVQCQAPAACREDALACVTPTPAPTEAPTGAPTPVPTTVVPLFYCWYTSVEPPATRHILSVVLGYNNTGALPLVLPVTTSGQLNGLANHLAPPAYNGQQPTLFEAGEQLLVFVVRDTLGVLYAGHPLVWGLTSRALVVTSAHHIRPERECQLLVPAAPPTEADDDDYLDADVPTVECSELAPNCTAADTFCNGTTVCNGTLCVPTDPSYDPCAGLRAEALHGPVVLLCVEELGLCVAYVNCTSDAQCQDGLYCNGKETCSNGTCYGMVNITVTRVCGRPDAVCIEAEQRCVLTDETVSPLVAIGLVAGAAVIVLLLLFFIFYYFARSAKPVKKRNK